MQFTIGEFKNQRIPDSRLTIFVVIAPNYYTIGVVLNYIIKIMHV